MTEGAEGTSQIAHRNSLSVLILFSYVQFGTSLLHLMIALADTPFEETIGLPVMLALIALGVKPIVNNSMVFGMMNIASYNQSAAEVLRSDEAERMPVEEDKRIGGICGAIMMVATIAGLVMLFVPHYQTPLFWLAWPIGGLCCGLVATLMKAFARE